MGGLNNKASPTVQKVGGEPKGPLEVVAYRWLTAQQETVIGLTRSGRHFTLRGVATGGISVYIPHKISNRFVYVCVWDINECFEIAMTKTYTPNQIPGYDRVYLDLYLQQGALTE